MANNVYTAFWNPITLAGTNWSTDFNIFSQGRTMKIKSVAMDLYTQLAIPAERQPDEINIYMNYLLRIGSAVNKIGKAFNRTAGTAWNDTGSFLTLSKATQLNFDSFYVSERLDFNLTVMNLAGAGFDFISYITLMVETEENIKY